MRSRLVLVMAVVLPLAGCARAGTFVAPRGPGAIGPSVVDPGGLGHWAARTWQRPERFSLPKRFDTCIQVGLERGAGLVRLIAGQPVTMARGDRTVCGSTALRRGQLVDPQSVPLLVERINVRGSGFTDADARTIVAGALPSTVTAVSLTVIGRVVPVTMDSTSRVFLAVLPGSVTRRELVLTYSIAGRRQQHINFTTGTTGTGNAPLVPGSLSTVLRMRTPLGARPLDLSVYRVRFNTIHGPVAEACADPGEVIGGESGAYNARWRDFLDGPTLVSLTRFTSGLGPVMVAAQNIGGCLNGIDDYGEGPVGGLDARRINGRLIVIYGFLEPGVQGLTVRAPDGSTFGARVDPATRAVLIPVASRGVRGERVILTALGGHPRRRSTSVATGPVPTAMPFAFALRDRGRTIRIAWVDSGQPFIGARLTPSAVRTVLSVRDLSPPSFTPDGIPYAIATVAIERCADIHLTRAVSAGTRFIDAATHRAVRPSRLHVAPAIHCTSVRPGQLVYVPVGPRG